MLSKIISIIKSSGLKIFDNKLTKNHKGKGFFSGDMNLKSKMIISFLLIAIVPIIFIASFSYISARNTMQAKITTYSNQLNDQTVSNINSVLSKYSDILSQLVVGAVQLDGSFDTKNENVDIIKSKQRITDFLSSFTTGKMANYGIALRHKEDQSIDTYGTLESFVEPQFFNTDNYVKAKKANGAVSWSYMSITSFMSKAERKSIVIMKSIKASKVLSTNDGTAIITLDITDLSKIFENLNLGKGSFVELVDENGIVLYDSSGKPVGEKDKSDILSFNKKSGSVVTKQNNLVTYGTCSNGWRVILSAPTSVLFKELNTTGIATFVVALIFILVAVFVGIFVANNISEPIRSIVELMGKAETGDFTVSSNYHGKNEVGTLAKSFNIMIHNIKELITSTKEVVTDVVSEAKNITTISQDSATTSEQVSCAVGEIAKGTSDQAKQADNVTQNMSNLSAKIALVTENVAEVWRISAHTQDVGIKSLDTVNILKQKSNESSGMINEINENVYSLNKSSQEIESIVNVLKNITSQTNLLSLNASIEAARAGEAGKGFAVVAQEIRKLAEQSNNSTANISNIILGVQNKVKETVLLVDNANHIFKEQENSVDDTNNAFSSIIDSTGKVAHQVEIVQMLIDDMNNYKNSVVDAISNIASVSEEASATAEEVMATSQEQSSSAQELSTMANKFNEIVGVLNKLIQQFKI